MRVGLEHEDWRARRSVAAGLLELCPIIESLWPNQFPEDLSRGALKALEVEGNPQAGALLASFLEWLSRIAVTRADYEGFEAILLALENAPHGSNHAHLTRVGEAHGGVGEMDVAGGRGAGESSAGSCFADDCWCAIRTNCWTA